jgi:RND family efflux transporter MFP subunit
VASIGCKPQPPAAAAQAGATSGVDRVVVGKPQLKTLVLSTTQPGRIEAFEEAPLFARVPGYVEKVHVDIGDRVEKDQVLATIAVPELRDDLNQKDALVAQAAAEVKQAEAAVEGAKAAVKSAEAKVAQAEAGIARTDADVARYAAEHKRVQELAANRSVTEKLVDETLQQLRAAEASQKEAKSAVVSASATLDEARVKVQAAESDVAAAAARLKVAEANRARADTLLAFAELKAPFAGVVTRRQIDTGHYVGPPSNSAAAPLLVVAQTDQVRVFVDVPELEAAWVTSGEKGDAAEIRVQALGTQATKARVTRSGWSIDPSNRSLRTEIDVPNADGVLRPGMFATATIVLEERPDVLALPATAVVREGTEAFCCVVVDGKIERRKIELGLRSGGEIEVRSGIAPDQAVVVSPVASLKPGQPVEVTTGPAK